MSAEAVSSLPEATPKKAPSRRRDHLREVEPAPRRARVPFVMVLGMLLALGLGGLVVLNTMIQTQAAEVSRLQAEATALGYQRAALDAQVQQLRSAGSLEHKAHALGMRPNPAPAFILLPSGKIVGKPTPVKGNELPDQRHQTWQQQTTAQQQARAAIARAKALEAQRKAEEARRKAEEARRKAEEARRKAAAKPTVAPKPTAQTKPTVKPTVAPKPTAKPTTGGR